MPRPPEISRPRYLAGALLDRASAARPVARAREIVRAARAREATGPAPDGLPYPPAQLRVLVTQRDDPEGFLRGGQVGAEAIVDALGRAGTATAELRDVLDFGCGCGRVARHLKDEPWNFRGCDYNPRAVAWCRTNLPFMDVAVNRLEPPAPYANDTFDLVYALSVLTHLTDEVGRAWIRDWRRILKPGGLLLATTMGDWYGDHLSSRQREAYERGRPVVTKRRLEGMNACVAFHPAGYVTETLLRGLEVRCVVPGGTTAFPQDVYVARVP